MQNTQLNQTNIVLIVLAIGAFGLVIARYLSNSESRVAQEYVDSLSKDTLSPDNLTLKSVIKDLLSKINSLERDKIINNDKISSMQHNMGIEREQTKFLTSNILKSTSA